MPEPPILKRIIAAVIFFFLMYVNVFSQESLKKNIFRSHRIERKIQSPQVLQKGPVLLGDGSAGSVYISIDVSEVKPGGDITIGINNSYYGIADHYIGRIELLFPEILTYKSSSEVPMTNQAGKLAWAFNTTPPSYYPTLLATVHLPMVGDTIRSVSFRVRLFTDVIDSANIYVSPYPISVSVIHPDPISKGVTKGVKWLRTKVISSLEAGGQVEEGTPI